MKMIGTMMVLLALGVTADADCRVVRRNHVVINQVDVLAATFVPVAYPAYNVGYAPVQDETAALKIEVRFLQQEAEILRLRAEIAAMRGTPIPQRGQPQVEPRIESKTTSAVFTACASCHNSSGRPAGAPQYFTDGVLSATPSERLDMVDAVMHERMPKGKKTTDEVATQIMADLVKSAKKKGV